MDVPANRAAPLSRQELTWWLVLGAVVLLGLALRLRGIHDPLLDHPGWRQGDTAAIARNFATLDYNPFHPQTDYNGPPPNYVELELQIVPFLAATLYKLFGIHEVFGRLLSIAFSLGTIVVLAAFGRWLTNGSAVAGLAAAALFAVYPGSVYYGRTFMPDTAMIFFFTAALYATARWVIDDDQHWRGFWGAALLTALALLAKPVAIVALLPMLAIMIAHGGLRRTVSRPQTYAFLALALLPLAAYDHYEASIAEWHWASGITRLHVIPLLVGAFHSWPAMHLKLRIFRQNFHMLPRTLLGPWCTALFAVAILASLVRPLGVRSRTLLFAWLVACLIYAFVVMTYERVDYYAYVVLPLAALWSGAFIHWLVGFVPPEPKWRPALAAAAVLTVAALAFVNRGPVRAYYHYDPSVYRRAKALDATLAPGALVVMGHYDPSILYYINRKGWEEDPIFWTPFDEQSAIRKGARYFIAVENHRLRHNLELAEWLQRFPLLNPGGKWPVYETDDAKVLPGAEARWRAFRAREKRLRRHVTAVAAATPPAPAASGHAAAHPTPPVPGSSPDGS
ncbi:MAG TPA: glycosyltransferase family 39 protein [Candidatus Acidoferrales bacterium]|nr:glycosyltransferase family 39 protein [Candidatus Acidoferrales bacterium]